MDSCPGLYESDQSKLQRVHERQVNGQHHQSVVVRESLTSKTRLQDLYLEWGTYTLRVSAGRQVVTFERNVTLPRDAACGSLSHCGSIPICSCLEGRFRICAADLNCASRYWSLTNATTSRTKCRRSFSATTSCCALCFS